MDELREHYRRKAEEDRKRFATEARRQFWARKQKEAEDDLYRI